MSIEKCKYCGHKMKYIFIQYVCINEECPYKKWSNKQLEPTKDGYPRDSENMKILKYINNITRRKKMGCKHTVILTREEAEQRFVSFREDECNRQFKSEAVALYDNELEDRLERYNDLNKNDNESFLKTKTKMIMNHF